MVFKIVGADENSNFPPRVEQKLAEKFADINTPMTPGPEGDSAYQVALDDGFVGTESAWLASLKGAKGDKGNTGDSAYQNALTTGFVGTMAEWIESLKGADGVDGESTLHEDSGDPGFYIF